MPTLSYLAILLGGLIVMTRLPGIFAPARFIKVAKAILKDENQMRVLSLFPFFFGISILLQKYNFTRDWTTVMSVMGWLMVVGSVKIFWWPDCVRRIAERWLKSEGLIAFGCLIKVALGVGLIYLGWYVY